MERWVGKVAVVTGASVGIGEAICIDLLKAGLVVVGLARRVELVEQIRDRVPSAVAGSLHAFKCDVTNETDIVSAFAWIDRALGGADILVNNAGLLQTGVNLVDAGNTAILKRILDTNVLGLVQCTREAFQSMRRRGVNDGHIVLINSICGHYVPVIPGCGPMNIYTASKHAVSAITEVLRQEFNMLQTRIKITSISPGVVDTYLFPDELKSPLHLRPEDIAGAVAYVIGTPPHVQVHDLIIRPLGEPF